MEEDRGVMGGGEGCDTTFIRVACMAGFFLSLSGGIDSDNGQVLELSLIQSVLILRSNNTLKRFHQCYIHVPYFFLWDAVQAQRDSTEDIAFTVAHHLHVEVISQGLGESRYPPPPLHPSCSIPLF